MSDADFDIIVVGSGCAGAVAAYVAASAGKSVLVVERGNYAGAKNMTGGRIYSHSLKEVFPDFESEAPLERKITHERIAMLNSDSEMTIDFTSPAKSSASAPARTRSHLRSSSWPRAQTRFCPSAASGTRGPRPARWPSASRRCSSCPRA